MTLATCVKPIHALALVEQLQLEPPARQTVLKYAVTVALDFIVMEATDATHTLVRALVAQQRLAPHVRQMAL